MWHTLWLPLSSTQPTRCTGLTHQAPKWQRQPARNLRATLCLCRALLFASSACEPPSRQPHRNAQAGERGAVHQLVRHICGLPI